MGKAIYKLKCVYLCLKTWGKFVNIGEFYFYLSVAGFNEYVETTDFPFLFSVPRILPQHVAEVGSKPDAISA